MSRWKRFSASAVAVVVFAQTALNPALDLLGWEPTESERVAVSVIVGAASTLLLALTGNKPGASS